MNRLQSMFVVLVLILISCPDVGAFEIPTDNKDISIRWDNTFRYTLAGRLKSADDDILNTPNLDDGDRNFDTGLVSSRVDILSEFDFVYKDRHGFRLTAAGWYDPAYNSTDHDSPETINTLDGSKLSSYTEDRYAGPDGEFLDAFIFTGFDVGEV